MKMVKFIPLLSYMALSPVIAKSLDQTTAEKTPSMKIVVGGSQLNLIEFNPSTHTFKTLSASSPGSAGDKPTFITFSPDGRYLFASNEVSNFRGLNQTGSVSSFEIQPDGKMRYISTGLTGADPASLAVSPDGRNIIIGEYTGGSWSRFSVNHLGQFASQKPIQVQKYHASGPVKARQAQSYVHQVVFNKAGDLVFFVDLGGDSVYVHRVDLKSGQLGKMAHEIKVPAGAGPRHLSLVEKEKEYDIYLISELSNQIFTIRLTDQQDRLESVIRQKVSTLPHGITKATTFGAGEVTVSRDERFVYGSNRQNDFSKPITDNSIVKFERDVKTGLLIDNSASSPTWFPLTVGGKIPRHFSLSNDPDQSLMVVGCQKSNTLLVLNRNHEDGQLKHLSSIAIDAPAVQLFLPK